MSPKTAAGLYLIKEELGSGAFGAVFLVTDRITGKEKAMKRILNKSAQKAFEREVKILHQLKNGPNIIPYLDYIYDENGSMLIFTDMMHAGTLKKRVDTKGTYTEEDAISILRHMANAIIFAQARPEPILHKDIKPENILGQYNDDDTTTWYLADWGLAEALSSTMSGSPAGTFPYMAPEVFDGRRCRSSDVYSLGLVLYYMLFARLPFDGKTMSEYMEAHQKRPIIIPAGCSPRMRNIIERMTEKDPARRWEIEDLEKFTRKNSITLTTRQEEPVKQQVKVTTESESRVSIFPLINDIVMGIFLLAGLVMVHTRFVAGHDSIMLFLDGIYVVAAIILYIKKLG